MNETITTALIDWSRAQFALTAMYHWIFVPLTLGLSFIIAFMESLYVKTGDTEWKRGTKFWMTLFGINFAIGVATGLILEFEFGTNWSNYSWFVGDIFGAPLAIEGIFAFFLESTFVALMFFGWNKLSKRMHLFSTWMVAIGSNLSAMWILVANAWMQVPSGMRFNPDTARNEMMNFFDLWLNPMAVNKFMHTITSGFVLASVFVLGVSAWYLLKKRHKILALRSIVIASTFGLLSIIFNIFWGDISAREIALKQPMKFAAFEGLYDGKNGAGLTIFAVASSEHDKDYSNLKNFKYRVEVPNLLSLMAHRDFNSFVPGVKDLLEGNPEKGIMSVKTKIIKGKIAIEALSDYRVAKKLNDTLAADAAKKNLYENYKYFGYGYFDNPGDTVPNIPVTFYSFRIMVVLGLYFLLLFAITLVLLKRNKLETSKNWLRAGIISIPLAYIASEAGWVTAEMGRQPWVVQDLMPTLAAISNLDKAYVQTTFWIFAILFTILLSAEIKIMFRQIKLGPNDGGH